MTWFRSIPWLVLAALAVFLAGAIGAPRPGHTERPDPATLLDEVGALPQDAQLVVAIDDAASLRASPGRVAMEGLLRDLGVLDRTDGAWRDLAAAIGLAPGPAFDALLGRRTVVIARRLGTPGGPEWVVLSEVSSDTEAKLRSGLKPALREVVASRQLLAIEGGRFEIAVDRSRARARGGRSTILFAPSSSRGLLDDLLDPHRCKPLREAPVFELARGLAPARILVLADLPKDLWPLRSDARSGELVLGLDIDGLDCRARLSAARSLAGLQPGVEIPEWSAAPGRALAPDALAVVMEWSGTESMAAIPINWPAMLDKRERVEGLLRGRVLLALREVEDPAARATAAAEKDPRMARRLAITLAAETTDVAALPPEGDAVLAALVPVLRRPADASGAPGVNGPDFGGVEPTAVRVVPVDGVANPGVQRVLGWSPRLAWTYAPGSPATMTPPQAVPVGGTPQPMRPGWWVVSLAPGQGGEPCDIKRTREALAADGDPRPLLSMGMVRPLALLPWIAPRAGADSPILFMRWMETLEWELALDEHALVTGKIDIRLHPTEPPPIARPGAGK